jgi:hypothetical protein
MEQTIEQKVASAILQRDVATIEINGVAYNIAPPTLGTLIAVSEIVSTLPIVEKVPNNEVVNSVLKNARHFKGLGKIASTLILGAKPIFEERAIDDDKKSVLRWLRLAKKRTIKVCVQDELAEIITHNVSPSVLFEIVVKRLKDMEVGTFFSITTSLSEANLLKPTKEVVH